MYGTEMFSFLHHAMQVHLDCSVEMCRVRRRARGTSVEARLMVLDERATP